MRTDEAPLHVWVEEVMGIPVSVHLRSRGALPAAGTEEAVRACFDELHDIDRVFSPYLRGSDVSRICRGSLAMEDADHRVATIADACRQAEIETDGLFSAYWQGWFDPTGYVKGWAVEEAARRHLAPLMAQDIAVGINAGGDMQLFTAPDTDWQWHIGIADPHHPGALLATLDVVHALLEPEIGAGRYGKADRPVDAHPRPRRAGGV